MNKKLQKLIMLLIAFTVIQAKAQQVTVTSTAGSGSGSVGGYSTLNGAFTDINNGVYQGDINIRIMDNFTITSASTLNASGTGSASYTSVLIRPADTATVTKQISTTTSAITMIVLNSADNVTIDGRAGGTGTSSLLEFLYNVNSGTTAANNVVMRLDNGATNNTIRYTKLTNLSVQAAGTGGALGSATAPNTCNLAFMNTTSATPANSNNTINNCVFTGARLSIFLDGTNASGAVNMDNLVFRANEIKDFGSRAIDINNNVGIISIDSNLIYNSSSFSSSNGQTVRCISVGGTSNRVQATITKNRIYDIKSSGFSGVSIFGIIVTPTTSTANKIDIINNSIVLMQNNTGVSASAVSGLVGICLQGGNSCEMNVYQNTIRIGGFLSGTLAGTGTVRSYCFGKFNSGTQGSNILRVKNNIFSNTRFGGLSSALATCFHMSAWYNTNTTSTMDVDYNTYAGTYNGGTAGSVVGWGGSIYFTGVTGLYNTNDANSLNLVPTFTNTTQPYLSGASLGDANLSAPYLSSVPVATDIDNNNRATTYCYKGAYEAVSSPFITNDLQARIIYTYGKIPVGTLDSIRFRVKNGGILTLTNKNLTVDIKGANTTSLTYTIPSIAGLTDVTYTFPGYTPVNLGYDTLTAYVPSGDQNTANDTVTWVRENTLNALSYTKPFTARFGNVGTNPQGEIIAKFNTPVNNFVNQVNVDFTNAGFSAQSFSVVIYEDSGSTWGPKMNALWVSSPQTTVNGVYNLSVPSVSIRSGYFYVGVRQLTANNIGFAYQNENPIRSNTFYFRQGATYNTSAWNDFSVNASNQFRFMIEPRLKINNDLGVTDLVSPGLCAGSANTTYSVNVENLGLLTQDFSVNPLSVYGTATDPSNVTTSFGPIVINSDTLQTDGNLVVALTNTYNMSAPGNYTFKAWTVSGVDNNQVNDTLPTVTRTAVVPATAPYVQTFNASTVLPSGWSASRFFGNASSGVSGTNSYRAQVNNQGTFFANAVLSTPRITGLSGASQLRFKYKVTDAVGGAATTLGSVTDSIKVLISSDCGSTYNYAYAITGLNHTPTTDYTDVTINLASYVGGGNDLLVKFVLDWFGTGNNSFVDLDDVRFIDTTSDVTPILNQALCSQLPLGAALSPTIFIANLSTGTVNSVSYGISITGPGTYSNSGSASSINSLTAVSFPVTFTPSVVGTYSVKIYSNYSGDNDIYNDTIFTSFTVFAGVNSFTVSNLATDSFTINWTANPNATSYNLDVATDAAFNSILAGYNDLSVSGTSQNVSGLSSGVKYYFRLRTVNSCGTSSNSNTDSATTLTLSTPLTLTAYLQGLYLGAGTMIASPFAADGVSPANIADTVTIELHDATSPYALAHTAVGTIGTNGVGNISLPALASGGTYYIVLKHRNSITTWSANPVTFNNASNSYNFSTAATQAYGDNMVDDGTGKFMIYSGDINQDGSVDFNDYPDLDVASSNGVLGYDANDLNGDASVDFNDYPVLDVNSSLGVIMVTP